MTLEQFSILISVFLVASQMALVLWWWVYLFSQTFRKWSLWLLSERGWMIATLIVAVVSTACSLVYSHAYELPICQLCYYQRMCMYPLVLFLGVAIWKRDYVFVRLPSIILSLIGAGIAGYHYYYHALSFFTSDEIVMPCSAIGLVPSCTQTYILIFGYITIPLMALVAFLLIASGLYLSGKADAMSPRVWKKSKNLTK